MGSKLSVSSQVRMLIGEIVRMRMQANPEGAPFDIRSQTDRRIVESAKALNVHLAWHEADGDDYRPVCICGWKGTTSDDIVARAFEAIEHTMAPENFLLDE